MTQDAAPGPTGSIAPDEWHRLHPVTIVKELGALAWAFAGALILDFDFMQLPNEGARVEVVLAAAVFAYAVVRYFFTAYRLTERTLELRRGVLVKSFQSMPRSRIQSVGVTTGLVGRFLAITSVEVSAADAEDIKLSFVSEAAATHLTRVLEPGGGDDEGAEPIKLAEEDRSYLARIDVGRLITFGLTETGFVVALLVLIITITVAVALGAIFAPLAAISVVAWPLMRTVAMFDLRAWIEGDRLRIEAGLLSRHKTEAPLARLQTLQVSRPPLRRALGYETVAVVTGDVSVSSENVVAGGTVAPLEPIGSWRRLAESLIGHVAIGETALHPSSRYTIRRAIVRGLVAGVVPVGGLAAVSTWLGWGWWPAAALAVVIVGITVPYARARWRVLGWAVNDDHLVVRRGVINRNLAVVPIGKVQDVTVKATVFQRRLGIATVQVDTAGVTLAGSIEAIDLELAGAMELADRLALAAARIALPDGV